MARAAASGRNWSRTTIANSGYFRVLTWADPVTPDLERQALVPMFGDHPVELGLKGMEGQLLDRLRAVPFYRQLFPIAFTESAEPFSVANVTRALAAFQRTVVTGNAPYDRQLRGEAGAMNAGSLRSAIDKALKGPKRMTFQF